MNRVRGRSSGAFRGQLVLRGRVPCQGGRGGGRSVRRTALAEGHDDRCMEIHFVESDIVTHAKPGSLLCEVAEGVGVSVSLGCGSGQCGMCEMEVKKFKHGSDGGDSDGVVVRTCITPVPRCTEYTRLEVSEFVDAIWGYNA